ncbi:MAG TPA: hypothetical protein VFR02_04140, partial [bacterium]|nr:hypothetical protein [bacterium]
APLFHRPGNRVTLTRNQKILLALLGAYLFRLGFGLSMPFWPDDQKQTYLIGLKCYTTGTWPYYGPDVNGSETAYTSQLPGALEGLVIALPLKLLPIPEAPFILLNLMSLFAIGLLTWYFSKKVPLLSPGFIFGSLAVLPWDLQESTSIINPSWCLFGSALFFLGFFEALPGFKMGLVRPALCNALMGFALFWVMQFHMSWMYLAALMGVSLFLQARERPAALGPALGCMALGALPSFAFMAPTLLKYGIPKGHNGSGFESAFNFGNFIQFFTILARYLSLACYELPRFLGLTTKLRFEFIRESVFTFLPGMFLWVLGLVQAVVLFVMGFRKDHPLKDWPVVRNVTFVSFLIIWASFWFTVKWPLAHIYYTCFPLVFLYSLYGWSRFAGSKGWRLFAKVYLASAFIFQIAYAVRAGGHPELTLYHDRGKVVQAIQQKDYRVMGERRENSYY